MTKLSQQLLLIALLVCLSAGAALGLRSWLHPPLHLQSAKLLPEPNKSLYGQGYLLRDADNHPVSLDILMDHWALLYFGCISCPDSATTLRKLAQMFNQFNGEDAQYKPIIIFVSMDPKRDAASQLENFTHQFNVEISGVTAQKDELARLADFFGTEKEYPFSSQLYILDPKSRYIGSFSPPYTADMLYSDMQQLNHQLWRYHLQR